MEERQIKSKERVSKHGEVFTNEREVKAMCDLVKQETERIESRFLEPACGNGNFLAEILERKLVIVKRRYGKSQSDYERYSFLAVSSLYGVELLEDNAQECRERLFSIWDTEYTTLFRGRVLEQCREAIRYLLSKNILCGDALSLKQSDGTPIIFSEWSFVTGNQVKRRDFRLDQLLDGQQEQISFDMVNWEYDEEVQGFLPKPIQEFPLVDYRRVQSYE